MKKYSVAKIESEGKRAKFFGLGAWRDGWIMPDGRGVDYAGYAQITFEKEDISEINYQVGEVTV